jgi:hypothetical protein
MADAELQTDLHVNAQIASLRNLGADRLDPVRFHFIETLGRRALQQQGEVRSLLDGRLAEALAAYRQRFEQAQNAAQEAMARIEQQHPAATDELQQLFAAGDFSEITRFVARLEKKDSHTPLANLTRHLEQQSQENSDPHLSEETGSRTELKAIRYFRNTWSKLSVNKQVTQAIEQAPENAGPLNSHMLVLRSLTLMRDISPDYLSRFMSYADTLLSLDQAEEKNRPQAKKPLATKRKKK